jgi:hypothetical protein
LGTTALIMLVFVLLSRGTEISQMPWNCVWDAGGQTLLFVSLTTSTFDFTSDLLYFVATVTHEGYQHPALLTGAAVTMAMPAICHGLRSHLATKLWRTGRLVYPQFRRAFLLDSKLHHTQWKSVYVFLAALVAWSGVLLLVPLFLCAWVLAVILTLVLGVNIKLFAFEWFLHRYRQLLDVSFLFGDESGLMTVSLSATRQVIALNEALLFELVLEALPQVAIVISNEELKPAEQEPWSQGAVVSVVGSIFFLISSLWPFGYRLCMKGGHFSAAMEVPVLPCSREQLKMASDFYSAVQATTPSNKPAATNRLTEVALNEASLGIDAVEESPPRYEHRPRSNSHAVGEPTEVVMHTTYV